MSSSETSGASAGGGAGGGASEPATPAVTPAATPAATLSPSEQLMAQGRQQVADKKWADAITTYKQVVALDAASHAARHNEAICHVHLRDYDKALEAVNRALQTKGGDKVAKYLSTKATVLMQKSRRAEAVEAVEAGLKLDPSLASLKEHAALKAPASAPAASSSSSAPSSSSTSSASASSSSASASSVALQVPPAPPAAAEPLAAPPGGLTSALAVLRPVALALLLVYFLPLDPALTAACWRFFLIATELCNVAVLLRKHVLPVLPASLTMATVQGSAQRAAVGAMADLGLPSVVLPVMLFIYSPRPSALALLVAFPAAVLNTYYACEAACGAPVVGALLAQHVAPRLTAYLVPGVGAGAAGEERRKRLVQGLVESAARYEVYACLILAALALTPLRNLGLATATGTLLYSKFIFNDLSRKVWREVHGSVRGALGSAWVPGAVGAPLLRGYDWCAGAAYSSATRSLAAAQERQRPGASPGAGSSCSVQ